MSRRICLSLCLLTACLCLPAFRATGQTAPAPTALAQSVSQYGITWTFDKPYPVGQFVTGDWWVVGPVTVVGVTPATGPAPADEPATDAKSIYGATSLSDDKRCRNGSMVIVGPTKNGHFNKQGYDSRAVNFDPALSIVYPYALPAGRSLVSTISSETYKNGKLATPDLNGGPNAASVLALDTAAVLTCLDHEPPGDAFRPAYAGTTKEIYETKDIRWDLLPALKPPASTPDWERMARVYQRPWIDHIGDWMIQFSAPGQNQPAYGGDVVRMNARASLMLLLDAPRERKQKLLIGFLQYGIDLHGLALCGREWFSDGGHWMGRKWPILFAGLLLDKPGLATFPPVDPARPILYDTITLAPGSEGPTPTTFFSEDLDTYYGAGANGATALWQVVFHSHPRPPYQEKPYAAWSADDKFSNNYFWIASNWGGFALAALYLRQKAAWDHDAFFDYCDWFMEPGRTRLVSDDGHPAPTRERTETFVAEMWDTYRQDAPSQPGGAHNVKWVWETPPSAGDAPFAAKAGHLVANPKAP